MGRQITNDFSWSKSRHEKFSSCLRAYYLHYYGSWGGWDRNAAPSLRQLYVLKKLSNRYTWGGSTVHQFIRDALIQIRSGLPLEPEKTIERARQQMRADFRHSVGKRYWIEKARKDFSGLFEHEYLLPLDPQEWKLNWDNVRSALEWFFSSRWVPLATGLKAPQWLEVDENDFNLSRFSLQGVRAFAVPDFAYVDSAGIPTVVDWKTGRTQEGYDFQLVGYAIYLSQRYRVPVESIRASIVYLNQGTEIQVAVDAASVRAFEEYFWASVSKMKDLLLHPQKNIPADIDHFPMVEAVEGCVHCVFQRACGREATAN